MTRDFAASLETLREGVAESKTSERTRTDKELGLVLALPGPFVRFFVWLLAGFAIYFPFGRKHSALAKE